MRQARIVMALVISGLAWTAGGRNPLAGPVSVDVDIGVFHDALAPYVDWIETARFGVVWAPARVDHGWRPYTRGHWVFTDFGWTWVGNEEWGWATDHYGRWAFDPAYGWIWAPGSQWGPAWVAWRHGGGYVGWAPLPPEVGIDMAGVNFDAILDPFAFTFVADRFLVEANLASHMVPVARNVTCVRVTNNITNYTIVENRVVNRGVEIGWVERTVGRPVPRFQVRAAETIEAASRGRVRGAEVAFYRPSVGPGRPDWHPSPPDRQPPHPARFADRAVDVFTRRHQKEAEHLQTREQRERQALIRTQTKEELHAPPGPSLDDLRKRHEDELKAQSQHEQRELQELQARQQREHGEGQGRPDRPKHRH